MDYLLHVCILACIYIILSLSLDLLVGQLGVLSMAQAAFFGLGAYTSALVALHLGAPFPVDMFFAMILVVPISLLISVPSLRLHDDYFVIATFGFQIILFSVLNNWIELTRGPFGIPGIPRPVILGWTAGSNFRFLLLAFCLTCLTFFVVRQIRTSPMGRVLRAIREDEIFAQALGKNTLVFKVTVFAMSAVLAAMAGSLYGRYITYIDPTNFTVLESILVISMVIIGGTGSRWGPVIGPVVLAALPEALRFVGFPTPVAANLRQIIYGLLLVIVMVLRPRGIVGDYSFGRR